MQTCQVVPSKIDEVGYYTILRLAGAGENAVVLSTADAHKVAKNVADGVLQARKEDGNFVMEGKKEDLDRYIASHSDTLFYLKPPAWLD